MGLFSSKKKVYVSSVVYNMAGDERDRPDFLKTAIIGHIASNTKTSIADTLSGSMLAGPGVKLRGFASWARTSGYNAAVGQISGTVSAGNSVNNSYLASIVPKSPGDTVNIQSVNIGNADYTYWVDEFILNNYPHLIDTNYVAEFRTGIGIRVNFEGGGYADFFPVNWDPQGRFMYVAYNTENGSGNYLQMYIYKYGNGNGTLDAMFAPANAVGSFFPFIPIRVNNQWVSASHPTTYAWAKKAYRKAFNKNFDTLIADIADNPQLGDIDYAYVAFGISLNTKENSAQKYVYNFFLTIQNQGTYDGSYASWQAAWNTAVAQMETWGDWKDAQNDILDPDYGSPEPTKPIFPRMPNNMTQVMSTPVSGMNYNMTIKWASLTESFGSGLKKTGAKAGDVWWEVGGANSYSEVIYSDELIPTDSYQVNTTYLCWQVDNNTWRMLTFNGLVHENMIYKGKAVDITAAEAIADTEESGFIVPLHEAIYREMGLKDGTQMATASSYLLFNCYVEKKIRWYQRGVFKVLIVIAIIAIVVVTAVQSGGTSVGLLGTAATVGATFGAIGLSAIIIGAVANALAAMLLMSIIQAGATAILGDKVGSVIAAIAFVVTMQFAAALRNGTTIGVELANLANADNILMLTSSVGNGYAGYVQAAANQTFASTQEILDNYEAESKRIASAYEENLGMEGAVFDPLMYTDTFKTAFSPESPDSFLNRTLMVGSDVTELSLALLDNFVEMSLNNNLNI